MTATNERQPGAGQHTPGPWTVDESITTPGFFSIYSQELGIGDGDIVYMSGQLQPGSHKANARLIAAAPELLEACQTLAEWLRREDEGLPAGIVRGTPEGESEWSKWWHENLRICALAQARVHTAIRKATAA